MLFIARAPCARSLTTTIAAVATPTNTTATASSLPRSAARRSKTTSVLLTLQRTRHPPSCLSRLAHQHRIYQTSQPCSCPSSLLLDRSAPAAPSLTPHSTPSPLRGSHVHNHFSPLPTITSSAARIMAQQQKQQQQQQQQQTREHGSHSHGHGGHNHHDNSFLVSTNKHDAGVRITRIGLYVNLGMAIGKGIGGYVFNSKALTADAMHSLTDLASDFMTLATVSLALKPPSDKYPSGYGKFESLGSLGVSGILLAGGLLMGYAAIFSLAEQFIPGFADLMAAIGLGHGHSHGHDHSHSDLGPNINAAWLAGGSIVIKEWLYRATAKIAKERKSAVLAANAYHHRVDSLTAFVALLTIAGSRFLPGADWLDPVGGLVISLMVIQAGLGNTGTALRELTDAGLDHEFIDKVQHAAQHALEDSKDGAAVQIRGIQGRKAGQNYLVDVEVSVPNLWSVAHTQKVEQTIRDGIATKVRGVKRIKVRFVPTGTDQGEFADEYITVSPPSSPEPESEDEKVRNGKKKQ